MALATGRRDERRSFVRENALAIGCFSIFAVFSLAHSVTGWRTYDAYAVQHGEPTVSYLSFVTTGRFFEATLENLEREVSRSRVRGADRLPRSPA